MCQAKEDATSYLLTKTISCLTVTFVKKESTSKIHPIREKLSPLGTSFRLILLWPIACLLLSYLVWSATLSKIDKEKVEAERAAYALAASYSKTYAEQITHGIEQIELLTLTLKYYWEHNRSAVSLEDQFQKGLYSPSLGMYLAMTDREGNVVTSTLTDLPAKLADREYFQFHETVPTTALRLDKSLYKEARSRKVLIHFTRRLEDPNGNFDGIILAAINHHYFASFSDENSLGPADLISIRHANGTLLVSEKGKDIRNHGQMHIEHPVFETDTGVKLLPAPKYRDHKARILAWHKITGYPLVAYVGLEQERLMESHIQSADNHRKIATAITIPLPILAILGLFFFTWLALRRKHAAEIKDTYYLAIDAAREGFYVVRALYNADHTIQDFIIEDCNERGAELIGYSKKTLIGVRLSKIYSGQQSIFRRAMESGFYEDEFKVPAEVSSQTTWVHRRLVRFGEGLAITLRDISEAKMHERMLVDMANTDALTKLPNRHWLTGFLPVAIESAKASKSALAL